MDKGAAEYLLPF